MTSDERAFLDAICEQPHDDTARLVYADWLTENGRADRAEFIRGEIELPRTPPDTDSAEVCAVVRAKPDKAVFMGSGLSASPSPGMTLSFGKTELACSIL